MGKNSFDSGDKVELVVGGPIMVVVKKVDYSGDREYLCQWFAGKKLESGKFAFATLKPAEEKKN